MGRVAAIDRANDKAYAWLEELDDELRWGDGEALFVALRATLHALRDQLSLDEALDLATQLPALLRGFFLEAWTGGRPRVHHAADFLRPIAHALGDTRGADAESVARAVFDLLCRHLAQREMTDLVCGLPREIAALFPADIRRQAMEKVARNSEL